MSTQPPPKGGVVLSKQQYEKMEKLLEAGDAAGALKILEKAAKGEYEE